MEKAFTFIAQKESSIFGGHGGIREDHKELKAQEFLGDCYCLVLISPLAIRVL